MSLRTTFTGALNVKLAEARDAGLDWVTITNLASITSGLSLAASKGQKAFTLNYAVTYQPSDLRLLGALWDAFKSGVVQGMSSEDVMVNEVSVKLNTSDNLSTSIDLSFTF